MAILTKEEFKTLAEISGTSDDTLIEYSILQAQGIAEAYCGRKFDEASITERYEGGGYYIELERWPVADIVEVKEYETTLTSSDYELKSERFLLRLDEQGYPIKWTSGKDVISVTYTGGYSDTRAPQDLKMAIYIIAFLIYKRTKMANWSESSRSFEGGSLNWAADIPDIVKQTLEKYRSKRII